ncbi:MAG: hypothetical protein FWC39_12885 [Bacteroidetes bacterium]|nr:hypothetical protein [Bacteroidota bacterium]
MKKIHIYIGIILLITACSKDLETPPAATTGFNYLPITKGKVTLYKQTIVTIDRLVGIYDTTEWVLRETIGEQIAQSKNSKTYRVEVQRRKLDDTQWQPYTPYELQLSNERIVRVDTNTAVVVLRFPQELGKTWQGNALNIKPNEKFKYTRFNIDTTIQVSIGTTIQTHAYDSVCEITHRYFPTVVSLQSQKELYRKDIGLLRKEVYNVQSQPTHVPPGGIPLDMTKPLLDRLTYGKIEILEILD